MLILVRDLHLLTTGLQLDADSFTKSLVIRGKCQLKGVGDVVVPAAC
jgi:hypothetical protein